MPWLPSWIQVCFLWSNDTNEVCEVSVTHLIVLFVVELTYLGSSP
jgi:hypothetical protein